MTRPFHPGHQCPIRGDIRQAGMQRAAAPAEGSDPPTHPISRGAGRAAGTIPGTCPCALPLRAPMSHQTNPSPANPTFWLLIHGAANSARVWMHWQQMLAADGIDARAIDLRGHGDAPPCDLSRTSMRDYADDAAAEARKLDRPVVVGWSMGGLIALMLAAEGLATACIALAPSVPARERDASVALREGEFGPEEYGITSRDPHDQPA